MFYKFIILLPLLQKYCVLKFNPKILHKYRLFCLLWDLFLKFFLNIEYLLILSFQAVVYFFSVVLHTILYFGNFLLSFVLNELGLLLKSFLDEIYDVSSPGSAVVVVDVVIKVVVVVVVDDDDVVVIVVVDVIVVDGDGVVVDDDGVVFVVVDIIVVAFLFKTRAVGVAIIAMTAIMMMIEIIIHHNRFFPINLFLPKCVKFLYFITNNKE